MSGDSLTILFFLLGSSVAAMIGAVPAAPGRRANALWAASVLFMLAALAWWLAPAASPFVARVVPTLVALVRSGALVMIGTVSIVALIIRRPKAIIAPQYATTETASAKPDRKAQITEFHMALSTARSALGERRDLEGAAQGMNRMRAALVTARDDFGLEIPQEVGRARYDLERGVRFVEAVVPLLRMGHDEEARRVAREFVAQNPAEEINR